MCDSTSAFSDKRCRSPFEQKMDFWKRLQSDHVPDTTSDCKSGRTPFQRKMDFWETLESDHLSETTSNFKSHHACPNEAISTADEISQLKISGMVQSFVPVPLVEKTPSCNSLCQSEDGTLLQVLHGNKLITGVEEDLKLCHFAPSSPCSPQTDMKESQCDSSMDGRMPLSEAETFEIYNRTMAETEILFDECEEVSKSSSRSPTQSGSIKHDSPVHDSRRSKSVKEVLSPIQADSLGIYVQTMQYTEHLFDD